MPISVQNNIKLKKGSNRSQGEGNEKDHRKNHMVQNKAQGGRARELHRSLHQEQKTQSGTHQTKETGGEEETTICSALCPTDRIIIIDQFYCSKIN